jgi:parallel beta-helix repeat protein
VLETSSNNNTLVGNNVASNYNGILVGYSSDNNTICHSNFIDNIEQVLLSESFNTAWDNGYPSGGNYWSDYAGPDFYSGPDQNIPGSDGIGDTPYIIDVDNGDRYPLMTLYVGIHDSVVTGVMPSKIVVGEDYSLNINVTAANQGDYTETFNVTVFANETTIETKEVTLASGDSTIITFTWNTTGFAKGNYTVSAVADIVLRETDTTNNGLTDGKVYVGVPGDLNADGTVDVFDAVLLSGAAGSEPGDGIWNPNADINNDNIVDLFDAVILSGHAGETET